MRKAALALCLGFLAGCAGTKVFLAGDYTYSGKIAVLPMANESNDLDAPQFLRVLILDGLAARGFQVLALNPMDAQLKVQGFTDGGQLGATTPQKLGEWIGADTLFYSTIESFDYINVGIYAQRKVKISARLVDAKTGKRLWETEQEGSTRVIATNKKDAEALFATQLAVKAVEKATHKPLGPESRLAVARLLNTLPRR